MPHLRRATPAGPWAQTNYNAAQSRASLGERTLTLGTVHRVRFRRSFRAQAIPSDDCAFPPGFVAPVLTGGDLFTLAGARLASYRAATGHRQWRVTPDPTFTLDYNSLAVAEGLVIIGGSGCDSVSDPNGDIMAFHASDGSPAWSVPITPDGGDLSQLVVSDGLVIATGNSPGSGNVVAVRRVSTGALVWFSMSNECSSAFTEMVVHNTVIYGGCDATGMIATLIADRISDGHQAWSRTGNWLPERGDRATSAGRNAYVLTPAGKVADLRPLSGRTRLILHGATSVLAVDRTRAYANCGSTHICAYRISTGKRVWRVADPSTSAAEAGGVLYLSDGILLSARTGARLRRLFHRATQASALVIGQGRIAVALGKRTLNLYGLPGS